VLALGFAVAAACGCQTAAATEYQPSLAQIGVTPTLHLTNTGAGVKIAVLDGYADYDINPDLSRNHGRVIAYCGAGRDELFRNDAFSAGDRLTFLFGRPLRVASGTAEIRLPTSREFDGSVNYTARAIDFGAGRMPLEAGFSYQAGRGAFGYGLEARVVDADATAPARLDAHFNAAVRVKF
jgi:hypothetical protein